VTRLYTSLGFGSLSFAQGFDRRAEQHAPLQRDARGGRNPGCGSTGLCVGEPTGGFETD
jgi:hypothetical protein